MSISKNRARREVMIVGALAGCVTLTASLLSSCVRKSDSKQKNFVAKMDLNYVQLAAWPAYSLSQAERFSALTRESSSYAELFQKAANSDLRTLLDPELCWFGRATEAPLRGKDSVKIYLEKSPEWSSRHSVSCSGLMRAMAAEPKLASLYGRLDAKARAMGADPCVYLIFSLTPYFGSMLVSQMKAKGLVNTVSDVSTMPMQVQPAVEPVSPTGAQPVVQPQNGMQPGVTR